MSGVYVHSYPPETAVLTIALPVILLPESIVIPIVSGFTPESSSVILNRKIGLLLMMYADAVGYVIVPTGAVFSLTLTAGNFL